jgi:ribosome-associated heat shock protein Hsp15
MTHQPKVRIDKWLWASRFFKTRSLATRAVNGGHVQVNGQRVKPARQVQAGDVLSIRRGPAEFEVVVRMLSDRRGPAVAAARLYEETPESLHRREQAREKRRLERPSGIAPAGRPDKRDRRKIRKFLRKG